MDSKIKTMIENCIACQAVGPHKPPEPMLITPASTDPWQSLAIDFYGPIPNSGQQLLVVVDTYSMFPEVEIVASTSAKAIIPKLDRMFATHGIPQQLKTDNGPPFNVMSLRDTPTPWELRGRRAHLYGHKVMGMLRVL